MMIENKIVQRTKIADAVREGLTAQKKFLPSWLFYDDIGDRLFQQIMQLPEYYLTRSETEILSKHSNELANQLLNVSDEWDIIELGAGDGSKTKILLTALQEQGVVFDYHAIDVSANALRLLKDNLSNTLFDVDASLIQADYLEGLRVLSSSAIRRPRLILFMGANIGNFELRDARNFLHEIVQFIQPQDKIAIGFDLMKDPQNILSAYNDASGVTRNFNLNVLTRLNTELDADFDLNNFRHWPVYNPATGSCRSYLISTCFQEVEIKAFHLTLTLNAWEPIYMEISQKYNLEMIKELSLAVDLEMTNAWFDPKKYFVISVFTKAS